MSIMVIMNRAKTSVSQMSSKFVASKTLSDADYRYFRRLSTRDYCRLPEQIYFGVNDKANITSHYKSTQTSRKLSSLQQRLIFESNYSLSSAVFKYKQSTTIFARTLVASNSHTREAQPLLRVQVRKIHSLKNCDKGRQLGAQNIMLSDILTRVLTTLRRNVATGSGQPIESEEEQLLANPKGNKKIKINACGKLYSELSKTKPSLYANAPKESGIDFEIDYYDSNELLKPAQRIEAPVVCMLHGAPGHYKDFASIINYLTAKGCRVVAPNFPDYNATFEHSFRHSPVERLDFLKKFFEKINVKHIDMLIGHSSAVYTMFEFLKTSLESPKEESDKINIRSLGLFSTPTYNLPPNMVVTPVRLYTLRLFDFHIFRPIIQALIGVFVKIQGIQNRVEKGKIENLLIAASAVGYSDSSKMVEQIKLIHEFKVPTFILYGCNDRLLPVSCFEQLKKDLGIESEDYVKHYKENGEVQRDAILTDNLIEISSFASGGHYSFQRYSKQVNEDVYNFLSRKVLPIPPAEATKL